MTERRGTKALELWCRRITDGYPGVNVQNMTTSWRDGLAFCAMIHHFRPDLIDFDSLNKDDVYGNNELAFRTAAEHLGIPALLDAEDMASCSVPDRLSILTYLSQFYQNFGGSSPSRLALSRTKESSNEGISPVVAEPTKPKMGPRVMGMRREACAVCGMPVFLAEKLMISRSPYHRTCFRCARCNNQLTPGNYYETEEGQYCCETCPDEEEIKSSTKPIFHQTYNDAVMLGVKDISEKESNLTSGYQRSLSDEEKTERRGQFTAEINERLVDLSGSLIPTENTNEVAENISQTAQMRLNFMANNMLSTNLQEDSENSANNDEEYSSDPESSIAEGKTTQISGDRFPKTQSPQGELTDHFVADGHVDTTKLPLRLAKHPYFSNEPHSVDISKSSGLHKGGNDTLDDRLDNLQVYETDKSFDTATSQATQHNNNNQRNSYLDYKDASVRQDTKDTLGLDIDCDANERQQVIPNTSQCLSLVQRRLKMFENPDIGLRKDETKINNSVSRYVDESSHVDGKSMTHQTKKINEDNRPEVSSVNMEIEVHQETDSYSNVEVVEEEEEKERDENDEKDEKDEIDETDENDEKDEKDISKNAVSLDKLEINVPPIVPKRLALEARKTVTGAAKLRAQNAEVTVLNAPGIDLSTEEIYPKYLNPFNSDDEGDTETIERSFENSRSSKISSNPFGSSDEEEKEEEVEVVAPPRPAVRNNISIKKNPEEVKEEDIDGAPMKRLLKAPQIHLNPFWSDDDEDDEDHYSMDDSLPAVNTPVPKPRMMKQTPQRKREFERGDVYASNSSLGSTGSTSTPGGTCRKKKPAPPPPIAKELFTSHTDSLLSPNQKQSHSSNNSLHTTPRARKAKPAPPPPMPTSTPYNTSLIANLTLTESPITDSGKIMNNEEYKTWDEPKIGKDEENRNKQSSMSCDETNIYGGGYTDKSVQGKWKRKKGPAPARPIPHRRKIKVMSLKDVKLELDEIEMQQQGLEKQGVRLEQLIRDKAETGNATEETSLGMDAEELVLELFVLVNEKNELFRRQAELMLLRRQQRLEEEHADIEYQIRCLLCQPEATKTDFDKQREESLIQRLVEIVERRNEIVECLEMDRRREVEEDRSINTQMGLYAAKNKQEFRKELENEDKNRSRKSKKSKLKEKAKEKILRKGHKKDADKDVDETEVKLKRQNKRKWF